MHSSMDVLGENGLLSNAISGFKPRLPQQQMAEAMSVWLQGVEQQQLTR